MAPPERRPIMSSGSYDLDELDDAVVGIELDLGAAHNSNARQLLAEVSFHRIEGERILAVGYVILNQADPAYIDLQNDPGRRRLQFNAHSTTTKKSNFPTSEIVS